MSNRACKNCAWYAEWPNAPYIGLRHNNTGVCTAPRPALGPWPDREVGRDQGENCAMFEPKEAPAHD